LSSVHRKVARYLRNRAAVTEYTGYSFNSFTQFGLKYIAGLPRP